MSTISTISTKGKWEQRWHCKSIFINIVDISMSTVSILQWELEMNECHRSSEIAIINDDLCHSCCSTLKNPYWFWLWLPSPSSIILTSPYEWKILLWDVNPQTNKQTNKRRIFRSSESLSYGFAPAVVHRPSWFKICFSRTTGSVLTKFDMYHLDPQKFEFHNAPRQGEIIFWGKCKIDVFLRKSSSLLRNMIQTN